MGFRSLSERNPTHSALRGQVVMAQVAVQGWGRPGQPRSRKARATWAAVAHGVTATCRQR
ncbi:hypothetical protein CWIS_04175 [Cellulomonas sp. A375-1]|nr:hypothetical protein CWIS_04175 [Cellulomonas sp. A375-1]